MDGGASRRGVGEARARASRCHSADPQNGQQQHPPRLTPLSRHTSRLPAETETESNISMNPSHMQTCICAHVHAAYAQYEISKYHVQFPSI